MTTGELLVNLSSRASGTAKEHLTSITLEGDIIIRTQQIYKVKYLVPEKSKLSYIPSDSIKIKIVCKK